MAPRTQLFTAALAFALAPHAPILASATENESDIDQSDVLTPEDVLEPPSCEFLDDNNCPKLKLRPAGGKGGDRTWTILTFESVEEIDSTGNQVSSHSIQSLQELDGFEMTKESREVGGVTADVTKVAVGLSFPKGCNGTELESPAGTDGNFAIETFVFPSNTTADIPYGSGSVYVFPGQIKFNIESNAWPFCSEENKLMVRMNVQVKSGKGGKGMAKRFSDWTDEDDEEWMQRDKSGKSGKGEESEKSGKGRRSGPGDDDEGEAEGAEGRMKPSHVKGKRFIVPAGDFDIDMDLPSVVLVDGVEAACEIELEDNDEQMNVDFTFPRFAERMVYDPVGGFDGEDDSGTGLGAAALMDLAPAPALGAAATVFVLVLGLGAAA